MSSDLQNQHLRLVDVELALQALAKALSDPDSAKRQAVQSAAQQLRVSGAYGAAAVLVGDLEVAPYRRNRPEGRRLS